MTLRPLVLKLSLAILVATSSASSAAPAVAVLPFENLSATETASSEIQRRIGVALTQKGWSVAPAADVEAALKKNRTRYLDSLDDETRKALLDETHAVAYVSGTVYSYDGGRNPVASFSARMVRADGTVAWGDVVGVAAADTERLFGFGRATKVEEVADAAMARLLERLPTPADDARLTHGPAPPRFRSGPATYRAPELDPKTPHLVCVLPFENQSRTTEASRVVADVLALRLASAQGFEVVDPAKLRAAALKARVPSFRGASNDILARLAPQIGTVLFLRGTIYDYADISGKTTDDPSLQLELSLVDVSEGRIVWSSQHERKGSDYTGLFLLGAASNAVLLTDRVVTEMIDAESQRASRAADAYAAARGGRKRIPSRHSELRDSPQKEEK